MLLLLIGALALAEPAPIPPQAGLTAPWRQGEWASGATYLVQSQEWVGGRAELRGQLRLGVLGVGPSRWELTAEPLAAQLIGIEGGRSVDAAVASEALRWAPAVLVTGANGAIERVTPVADDSLAYAVVMGVYLPLGAAPAGPALGVGETRRWSGPLQVDLPSVPGGAMRLEVTGTLQHTGWAQVGGAACAVLAYDTQVEGVAQDREGRKLAGTVAHTEAWLYVPADARGPVYAVTRTRLHLAPPRGRPERTELTTTVWRETPAKSP